MRLNCAVCVATCISSMGLTVPSCDKTSFTVPFAQQKHKLINVVGIAKSVITCNEYLHVNSAYCDPCLYVSCTALTPCLRISV